MLACKFHAPVASLWGVPSRLDQDERGLPGARNDCPSMDFYVNRRVSKRLPARPKTQA